MVCECDHMKAKHDDDSCSACSCGYYSEVATTEPLLDMNELYGVTL